MKLAWICFHKNKSNYPEKWIKDYKNSILNQTVQLPIYEINYGNDKKRIFDHSIFYHKEFATHAEAHNYILDKAFQSCDYVFNSNVDDIYDPLRVEMQSQYLKYDVISCDMSHIDEYNNVTRDNIMFSAMDIKEHLYRERFHNIIAHPGVVYGREFWQNSPKLNPQLIPEDDYYLWKWGLDNGYTFKIVPYTLLYYRIHSNNISRKR